MHTKKDYLTSFFLTAIITYSAFISTQFKIVSGVGNNIVPALQNFESSILGVKLQYPANWSLSQDTYSKNIVTISLKPNDSNTFSEGIDLSVQQLVHRYKLDRFVNEHIGGSDVSPYSRIIEDEAQIDISGVHFTRVLYSLQDMNTETGTTVKGEKYLEYFGVNEMTAYILSYHSNEGRFLLHLPMVEKIVKSLIISGSPIKNFVSVFGNIANEKKYAPLRQCDILDAQYYRDKHGLVSIVRSDSVSPIVKKGDVIGLNHASMKDLKVSDIVVFQQPYESELSLIGSH